MAQLVDEQIASA